MSLYVRCATDADGVDDDYDVDAMTLDRCAKCAAAVAAVSGRAAVAGRRRVAAADDDYDGHVPPDSMAYYDLLWLQSAV